MEYYNERPEEQFGGRGGGKRPNTRQLREKPPRYLNLLTKAGIVFGGSIQQFGWTFGGFGMIFVWVFVMQSEARYLLSADGPWLKTEGELTRIAPTNSSVNKHIIYAYSFRFQVGAEAVEGESYAPNIESLQEGQMVTIEYKSKNLKRARVEGTSTSTFPIFVLFVLLFPIVGFSMVVVGIVKNIKALGLLVHGEFTKGRLVEKRPTNTRINNMMVYKIGFEFDAGGGRKFMAYCSTHETWKVEDEEVEIILFDPNNPQRSIVFDAVANTPKITPEGTFDAASFRSIVAILLPVAVIVINYFVYVAMSAF